MEIKIHKLELQERKDLIAKQISRLMYIFLHYFESFLYVKSIWIVKEPRNCDFQWRCAICNANFNRKCWLEGLMIFMKKMMNFY